MAAHDDRLIKPIDIPDDEAITVTHAAELGNVTRPTIANWCKIYGIGRQASKGMTWRISGPAVLMIRDGDGIALRTFLKGERNAEAVKTYIEQFKSGGAL